MGCTTRRCRCTEHRNGQHVIIADQHRIAGRGASPARGIGNKIAHTGGGPTGEGKRPAHSVSVPTEGVSVAKLTTAIRAEVETRAQARRTRGLKMPDWEAGVVRMVL